MPSLVLSLYQLQLHMAMYHGRQQFNCCLYARLSYMYTLKTVEST